MQTPAVENPPPEEVAAENASPELPDAVTLPEPPVEVEVSGSGEQEEPFKPAAPTDADDSVEHTEAHEGLISLDDAIKADTVTVEITDTVEEAAIQTVDEQQMNGKEVPEEVEVTTTASKTTYEEVLPAEVPLPEAVDLTEDASEPTSASAAVDKSSAEEDSIFLAAAPTDKMDDADHPAEEPGEEASVHVVSTNPDIPVTAEEATEAATESEGREVMEETLPEAPAAETEGSESPQILPGDLAEDEILLVNRDETEPPVVDVVSHAQPTALSPERESPFTRISEMNPATKEQPRVNIPSLVEVMVLALQALEQHTSLSRNLSCQTKQTKCEQQ